MPPGVVPRRDASGFSEWLCRAATALSPIRKRSEDSSRTPRKSRNIGSNARLYPPSYCAFQLGADTGGWAALRSLRPIVSRKGRFLQAHRREFLRGECVCVPWSALLSSVIVDYF